jgi:hypothetical protein
MRPLVLSDDPVLVNFVETLLREAGIEAHVLDRHASALMGAVGRVPQRVVVADNDWERARGCSSKPISGLGSWMGDRACTWRLKPMSRSPTTRFLEAL